MPKCIGYLLACAMLIGSVIITGCQHTPGSLQSRFDLPEKASSQYAGDNPERPRTTARVRPDPDSGPLGLPQCIHIALHNSPRARISMQTARASATKIGKTRGKMYPQLDFSANAVRSKSQVLTEVEDVYNRTTYDAKFGLRQLLFDGGKTQHQVWAAEAALRSADFKHNRTLQAIALNVERTYYRLLTAKGQAKVARDMVDQRKQHVEMARRKLEAGRGRRADVLKVKARLAEARFNVVDAKNQVRKMRGRLNSAMGLPPDRAIQIQDVPMEIKPRDTKDVGKLIAMAAKNRPRLRAAAEKVNRWEQLVASEGAKKMPTVTANVNYGWNDVHLAPEDKEEYTLSVGLEWPLFTGFQTSYSIRQAKAELRKSIQSYQNQLRNIELEVWNAFSEVVRARESVTMARSYVASAKESLETTERGYKSGRATIVELIDAQTELTRSRFRRLRARLQWYESIARVERAVGKILSEDAGGSSVLQD